MSKLKLREFKGCGNCLLAGKDFNCVKNSILVNITFKEDEKVSKFKFELSYKDVMILKHSLERRIEADSLEYDYLKKLKKDYLTDGGIEFIKEYEEHVKCLKKFEYEMVCAGYRNGKNIFGKKYE